GAEHVRQSVACVVVAVAAWEGDDRDRHEDGRPGCASVEPPGGDGARRAPTGVRYHGARRPRHRPVSLAGTVAEGLIALLSSAIVDARPWAATAEMAER